MNPYESPADAGKLVGRPEPSPLIASLALASIMSFWIGLAMALVGSLITFYPGAECGWFAIAGGLTLFGVFVRTKTFRVVAIVGALACFACVYAGYRRGVEHQETLQRLRHSSGPGGLPNNTN